MQRLSLAVALLIGAASTININSQFVSGVYGDEDLSEQLKEMKNKQAEDVLLMTGVSSSAAAAAKAGSGVRARWIELPDCQDQVAYDGDDSIDPAISGKQENIPLLPDLSNAIIATCKGPHVARTTPVNVPIAGPFEPRERSQIFDPVWKTSTTIPDHEHQVQQLQHGHVDISDETEGPKGDLYPYWKYKQDSSPPQPFQDALANGGQDSQVNAWQHDGPGGVNYTDATMPTNYNNSLENTFGQQLPRNTGTPMPHAAGNVAHVTPDGISWGDGTHFVQPTAGVFNATTGMFIDYAAAGPAVDYNNAVATRVPVTHMAIPDTADSKRITQEMVDADAGAIRK